LAVVVADRTETAYDTKVFCTRFEDSIYGHQIALTNAVRTMDVTSLGFGETLNATEEMSRSATKNASIPSIRPT
jgi:hypothetical protein